MAEATIRKTKPGRCPDHGQVDAVKEVPRFKAPGLFWLFQYGAIPVALIVWSVTPWYAFRRAMILSFSGLPFVFQ